ncbi:MAG: DNA/RNA helicase [Verrucomicrobiaceae bacterium]|nr:MAG: DNA/RNA helicase [Verrucomicrobiaceae bacterium]
MIEVIGIPGSPEYAAAEELKAVFERVWPGVGSTPIDQDHIRIAAGTKLAGYKVSDVDIVIAARFSEKRYIVSRDVFVDKNGARVPGAKVRVRSFVAAIEVKDHDASRVKIEGGAVHVRYPEGWKDATQQNDNQRYALLNYFSNVGARDLWVYRCLMLRGISTLPRERGKSLPEAGAVAADLDGARLLMAMAKVNGVSKRGDEFTISSGSEEQLAIALAAPIFTPIVPSRLDRARMDRVASRPEQARELASKLGRQLLHLRGHGGTGKTVLMLQVAHEAYVSQQRRSLVLTYNHALAADIQRLLALLQIPSESEGGGIDVRTIMSFTYAWLSRLGVADSDSDPEFERYEEQCGLALSYLSDGVLGSADISAARQADPSQFGYDAILVDEAQDLPQPEAELLCALYGRDQLLLADGVSQVIRGRATNWRKNSGDESSVPLHFRECLRMKANLAKFANAVAKGAGLNWSVIPNTQAAGGKVIIVEGEYKDQPKLWASLLDEATTAGNAAVDLLHCVPPSGVFVEGNHRASKLGVAFSAAGITTWDGVDLVARRDFPRSKDCMRVVQFESCRGLEGWTVVLDGLDEHWEGKYQQAIASVTAGIVDAGMIGKERYASNDAWQSVMIGLTRPIDTLVISLRNARSNLSRAILEIASTMPDIVEVRRQ